MKKFVVRKYIGKPIWTFYCHATKCDLRFLCYTTDVVTISNDELKYQLSDSLIIYGPTAYRRKARKLFFAWVRDNLSSFK